MSDPNDPYSGGAVPPPPPFGGGGAVPPPPAPPGGGYAPPPPAPPGGGYQAPPPAPPGGGYAPPPPAPPGGGYQAPPPGGGYQAPPPGGGYQQPSSGSDVYVPEVGANLAEPVQRLVGDFIDYVIIAVPYFIISLILFSVFTTTETVFGVEVETGRSYVGYLLTSLVGAAIAFGYAFVLLKGQGTTIGKKVMGMRVARADGQPLDQQTILIRSGVFAAPYFLSYLIPVLGWLLSLVITVGSLILIFTDKRRESVLDKAAKTVVVSTK